MANFVLSAETNVLLIDTANNGLLTHKAAIPWSSVADVLSVSLWDAGVGLDQTNLIATFDGNTGTSGQSPLLRFRLANQSLVGIGEQDFIFQWKLTLGVDGIRTSGERQVFINDGLSVHVGPLLEGRILLYANAAPKKLVTAISGSDQSFSATTSFTNLDVIGEAFMVNGVAYLDLKLLGLISKLDSSSALLKLAGYTPQALLYPAIYNLTLSGLPLVSATGVPQTLSIVAPVDASPNHAPVFVNPPSSLILRENTAQTWSLQASDPDGQNFIFSIMGGSDDTVTATIDHNQVTFTPAGHYANAQGIAFQIKVTDSAGAYNLHPLTVAVNAAATLLSDAARAREGSRISGNVLANDSDPDSVLAVQTYFFSGAPYESKSESFSAGTTVDLLGIGHFSLSAEGEFSFQSHLEFSGNLPTVHYVTPQGEEAELTITVIPASQAVGPSQLSGRIAFWNAPSSGGMSGRHSLVDGVKLSGLDELATQIQSTTDISGRYNLPGFQPLSVLPLTIGKPTTTNSVVSADVKSAITLSDVLDALKIYLNKSVTATSNYKYIAADFDANGTVNLSDVLGILKTYLGKVSTAMPSWTFVEANTDVSGLGNGIGKAQVNSAFTHTFSGPDITSDTQNWVAVLRGDVNGSWVPPTPNVENISHDQFLQLVGVSTGSV